MSNPHNTNSFTALALAPGVLKTGIPSSVMRGTLQLFVPAPHLTIARHVNGTSLSWILWERSMMACATGGWSSPGLMRYISGLKRSKPCGLILLKVLMTKRLCESL